jgi:hypothetical protein
VNLHHFYHCYSGINSEKKLDTWKPILEKHITSVIESNLINHISPIKIGITSDRNNFDEVKKVLDSYSIPYEIVVESKTGWEQETLCKMHDFAQSNDGYVLYAHSKGAYTDIPVNHTWRETMTYFNVLHWEKAVEKLSDYDAVGCYWIDDSHQKKGGASPHQGQRWFAGTFWWSKLSILRNIEKPRMLTRWDAEVWIGHIPGNKIYDLDYGRPAGSSIPK